MNRRHVIFGAAALIATAANTAPLDLLGEQEPQYRIRHVEQYTLSDDVPKH
jgi:hypothetical protein